ncbi:hypothetical protein [Streptomyces sp. NPDC051001]|uniref:hypothetical protein n=1 Tax=Streptomyces sp. NPDC051001 TaxID=3155795 RepID=UPI003433781F
MSSPPPAWSLPEPMRAVPVNDPALAGRWADSNDQLFSRNERRKRTEIEPQTLAVQSP